MSMAELSKNELDLVILEQINGHHFGGELAGHRTATQETERVKDYTTFFHKGLSICLKTFHFIHNVGNKRFRNLMKQYKSNGICVRTHGNVRRRPWNAASLADKQSCSIY